MSLAPGTRLGPYEVASQIGKGGMGEVYRAVDTNLARQVAIKVLPDSMAADAERLARFDREAKTLAALNHPNIAAIYGLERSHGQTALVMELVEGPTLADHIAEGAIPVEETLAIAKQIAQALEAAHEQGIIHRDLKPANIKVRPDGTVKVLDFGLAKAMEPTGVLSPGLSQSPTITTPAMTQVGLILGTAAYMSPEQAKGKPADKRSDIWAFGCVVYEMLSGKKAFEDEDVPTTLSRVLQREPDFDALPEDLPAWVRQTLRLCLRKPHKERVPDVGAVRLALEGAFESAPSQPRTPARNSVPLWRRMAPIAGAALVGTLATAFLAWTLWPRAQPLPVNRFEYRLPPGDTFSGAGGSILALSPDGRYYVYNTPQGLYLRSFDNLETRVIPGTQGSTNMVFSPDGESLAYVGGGSLKRISIRGGAAQVIATLSRPQNATDENSVLIYAPSLSWEANDMILIGGPGGIAKASATGGNPEVVIRVQADEQVYGPRLLPDGDSVLYTVTTGTTSTRWDMADLVVQSLSTGRRTKILSGGSDGRYVPTGHLVYAVGETLFAVRFDLDRLRIIGPPVTVIQGIGRPGNQATSSGAAFYAVSAQGTLIYARAGSPGFLRENDEIKHTLVWVDRQGREETLNAQPRGYIYPRISPDGTRIALDSRDQAQDVWVWDIRRQSLSRLTSDPELDGLPVWTPDGQRSVWSSQRAGGNLNLYWQRADGTGEVERLTDIRNAGHRASSFTPDGKVLVFSTSSAKGGRSSQDLAMLSLEGTRTMTPLVSTMFDEQNGEVSPDGRWLAYESNESGQFQVYVRPFPSVDRGRWPISVNGGRQPAWSRNGRELFYIASDGALMSTAVNSSRANESFAVSTPMKLMDGAGYYNTTATPNRGRTYDVSPDGSRFLRIKEGESEASASRRSLVIVLNWNEELNRLVPKK